MIATFSVGNLGKRVAGTIPVTSAEVDVAEDGTVRGASAELDIAAIDTGHTRRDRDLRKPNLRSIWPTIPG
jgi:polyisoprenoid-binding protein YceI